MREANFTGVVRPDNLFGLRERWPACVETDMGVHVARQLTWWIPIASPWGRKPSENSTYNWYTEVTTTEHAKARQVISAVHSVQTSSKE